MDEVSMRYVAIFVSRRRLIANDVVPTECRSRRGVQGGGRVEHCFVLIVNVVLKSRIAMQRTHIRIHHLLLRSVVLRESDTKISTSRRVGLASPNLPSPPPLSLSPLPPFNNGPHRTLSLLLTPRSH